MPTCERGHVVRVPFPYTDRPARQHRPALVIATPGSQDGVELVWVLMITSAANRRWPDDVDIEPDAGITGLPVPSIVRTRKVATIDAEHGEVIGQVGRATLARVTERVLQLIGG